MLNNFIKNLSILKKFLFINLIIFIVIGSFTIFYLRTIQPNLINDKTINHIKIIDNTISHIQRLKIKFTQEDIRKFLFSTRFLFQSLDRVLIFDKNFNLIGDTDSLDLDPRSFSQRLEIVEMEKSVELNQSLNNEKKIKKEKKPISINEILIDYSKSSNYGKPFTFTEESYDQFLLTTIKNVFDGEENIGYLAITESANDIRAAINERKSFITRTALVVVVVILIFLVCIK